MIAADTNLLVRLLVVDDSAQSLKARRLFERGGVLILKTVLLETEWVLRSRYQLERERIARFFRGLAETEGIEFEHDVACRNALSAYEQGMGFADALHVAAAASLDVGFQTFDQDLQRKAKRLLRAKVQLA